MKKNASLDGKKIDWMITLLPLGIIIALCILFFFMPEQSNAVLSQIRFFFGDTFGTYYLIIGLGIFLVSIYIAASKYGDIVLGEPGEKPKYSFFSWGAMMFTCGLAADILFYSFSEWVLYSGMGRCIPAVSLELYSVGLLSCTGSCFWLHASCTQEKTSEIFRGLPPNSW